MAENHYTKRFWDKVDKRGPDECWPWTANKFQCGYGSFKIDGKQRHAHRVVWELINGQIPKGEGFHGTCVLHRCDNRPCVNPAHLFLGTQADNMADKIEKGRERHAQGEAHSRSKLTEADVRAIRASDWTQAAIAKLFGVSQTQVSRVRLGKNWKHLD